MEQRHSKHPLLWSRLRVSVCQQPSASTFLATQNLQLHTITYGHGCWVCSMYVWHRQCLIWEQYYTLPTYLRDHRASSRPLLVWTSDICTCHVAPRSTSEHLQEERLDKSVWDSTWPILSHQRTPYPRMYVCTFIILALVREKCHKRPQKVAQVTVCLRSVICCVHWMSTSALSALLPQTRNGSDTILGKRARIVWSVSTLWISDLQFSQHCREQWTKVTPSLVRALYVYSKVC